MSTFHFKRFSVCNERSSMKVNTDGVLLGAVASLPQTRQGTVRILDAGTGTGTIALMLAQRMTDDGCSEFKILGIDIDNDSAEEAAGNFGHSPWAEKLEAANIALNNLSSGQWDLIASNPPYFDSSLQNPDGRKNSARHTGVQTDGQAGESLSYRELASFASERLSENGILSMILPSDREKDLLRCCRGFGLHLRKLMRIRSVERKEPCRIIAEFGRSSCSEPEVEELTLMEKGKRTERYTSLTKEFYL